MNKFNRFFLAAMLLIGLGAVLSAATPIGPDTITNTNSSRKIQDSVGKNLTAIAGNITALEIAGTTVTDVWQGYFGNITGTITLDDANNRTMYDWVDLSPSGEIYAVRTANAVTWGSINCSTLAQIGTEETALNIAATERDGINETFNKTISSTFSVGALNITAGTCQYGQYLYENSAAATLNNFAEVLLHDGTYMVYTAVINQNSLGYDNSNHDFQLMVAEDGHSGDTATSQYYFYVEIN